MVALAVWLVATAIVLGTGILAVLAVGGLLVQFMLGVAGVAGTGRASRAAGGQYAHAGDPIGSSTNCTGARRVG